MNYENRIKEYELPADEKCCHCGKGDGIYQRLEIESRYVVYNDTINSLRLLFKQERTALSREGDCNGAC